MAMRNERNKELKRIREELSKLANRRLTVGEFLEEAVKISDDLIEPLSGIWCGSEGRMSEDLPSTALYGTGSKHMVVVTWYAGRVEVAYLS
jgi:hypothetical protein